MRLAPVAIGFAALLILVGMPLPAAGAAVTITAAEMITEPSGLITGVGVRIVDGRTVVTGARVVLDPRRRTAIFSPGIVRSPQGTLQARRLTVRYSSTRLLDARAQGTARMEMEAGRVAADQILLDFPAETLTAAGRVLLDASPLQASAGRLAFARRSGLIRLSASVRVRTPEGTVEAARMDAQMGTKEAHLSGGVAGRLRDITFRADSARLNPSARTVILNGAVRLEQQGRMLWASAVTIDYGVGHITATGPLRLRIADGAVPSP